MSMRYRVALITGASSGLGESFAWELACRGSDLVLVGRDIDRLTAVGNALRERHAVNVELIVADLAEPADVDVVEKRLGADPPIDLLVNNAGLLGRISPLIEQDPELLRRIVEVDVWAVVRLCRAALGSMAVRGCGRVLNVSSVMAFLPAPQAAVYGAAKAFVTSFSESVDCEARGRGVRVVALCPGSVRTGLHKTSGRTGGHLGPFLDAREVVRQGLAAAHAGDARRVPGTRYLARVWLAGLLPRRLVQWHVLRRWRQ
jgi:uncharacterized protein